MSGYKSSYYRIEATRERRMELSNQIDDESSKLKSLIKKLKKELKEAPEGLKKTFSTIVRDTREWIDRADNRQRAMVSEEGDVPYLKNTLKRFSDLREEGEVLHDKVMESFNDKADKMEKRLLLNLSRLETDFMGKSDKLDKWAPDKVKEIQNAIDKAEGEIRDKDFATADRSIVEAKMLLNKSIEQADNLEMKHRKRLYLLKALRQVCSEMGFEETKAPVFEDEEDKTKPIEFEVDTLDQGKITFYLSLDGIRTYSQIMDGKCISEFDQLSDYLEEEFGVKTKFVMEDEKPDDVLIAKGELEIPDDDSVMYMEKQ